MLAEQYEEIVNHLLDVTLGKVVFQHLQLLAPMPGSGQNKKRPRGGSDHGSLLIRQRQAEIIDLCSE